MQVEECVEQAVRLLKSSPVTMIVSNLRRLVEVPFNARVMDTLNTLQANDVQAVAVAAPPGKWIGAGGSTILEKDGATGVVRKQYIGMVSTLDILYHMVVMGAEITDPISDCIGHSVEGLNLWTIGPDTSVYDAIELMSKGVHRVLIPFESNKPASIGTETMELSSGYHVMSQMDVLKFILDHTETLEGILSLSIAEVGAAKRSAFAAPTYMTVEMAFRSMLSMMLPAAAIVETDPDFDPPSTLINGEGRYIVGTISVSDIRGCSLSKETIGRWSSMSVLQWNSELKCSKIRPAVDASVNVPPLWQKQKASTALGDPVTCRLSTPLGEAIALALEHQIHRVWITNEVRVLMGLVSLTDMLSVFHKAS